MPSKQRADDVNRNHPNLKAREMPKHLSAEKAVLCCALVDDKAAVEILSSIKTDDFYSPSHACIFEAMLAVSYKNMPIDLVTMVQQLEEMGQLEKAGGIEYLTSVTNELPSAANAKHYMTIVRKNALLRNIIETGNKMIDLAYTGDPDDEALNFAEKEVFKLSERTDSGAVKDIREATNNVIEKIEELCRDPKAMRGIPTGFSGLNAKLNGLQRSDLILIAARPGQGKTSIGMNLIQNVALNNTRKSDLGKPKPFVCAVFSLEMPAEQLAKRMLCSVAKVNMGHVNSGTLDKDEWKRLTEAKNKLDKSKIYIFDSSQTTPMEILSRCRRLKREHGLDLVMVDYLQLMSTGKRVESRQQEISEITRTMKITARELDVPILLLSQMSREVEKRTNKRPQMSDLRESGAIEQDADIILFIYREFDNPEEMDEVKKNKVELIIAKHRNGEPGSVEMKWQGQFVSFLDVDNSARMKALEGQMPPPQNTGSFDLSDEDSFVPSEKSVADILKVNPGAAEDIF